MSDKVFKHATESEGDRRDRKLLEDSATLRTLCEVANGFGCSDDYVRSLRDKGAEDDPYQPPEVNEGFARDCVARAIYHLAAAVYKGAMYK